MKRFALPLAIGLLCAALPVPAAADYLGGIAFSQPTPSTLPNSEFVTVSIDYKVDESGGGVVFARPYSEGAPTPGYVASGGASVPAGTGTVTQQFRIATGAREVDHVRVYLKSPDLSETWLDVQIPVCYLYGPNAVYDIVPNHTEHSILKHEQSFILSFAYACSDPAGCYVFARPYTNGAPTPGYSASGSTLLPQSGTTTQSFSFDDDADVTHIRYKIMDHTNTTVLFTHDIPFVLRWRSVGIYDITFNWSYESNLHNSQRLYVTATLDHDVNGVTVFLAWCTTNGIQTPGCVFQWSVAEPSYPHQVSRYTYIAAGDQYVDGILFSFTGGDNSVWELMPVDYHWGPHAVQNPSFTPLPPAILSAGEHLAMSFDYLTSSTDNVHIFPRPAYDYELVPGYAASGSPSYAPPSGSGSSWVTFPGGEHQSDSMRFLVTNLDQSENLLTHFYHGWFVWGSAAVVTALPEPSVTTATRLGKVYPNPFNPVAMVPVELDQAAAVRLAVFDLRGRHVQTLYDGDLGAGRHEFRFDGRDLASGTYICRLSTPWAVETRKIELVR